MQHIKQRQPRIAKTRAFVSALSGTVSFVEIRATDSGVNRWTTNALKGLDGAKKGADPWDNNAATHDVS